MAIDDSIPLEIEDGINLDHPDVRLFRSLMLQAAAKDQGSDLYCPLCETNLPYNQMTVAVVPDGVDANLNPVGKTSYFCTLCEDYFD